MISASRYLMVLACGLFSLCAHADTPPVSTPDTPTAQISVGPAAGTPNQPLSDLSHLQAAADQLQGALNTLQQQSNQLQNSLSTLNQQIEQSRLKNETVPGNAEQLQLLRNEYLQAQDTLIALRQQQMQLQEHVAQLHQQLTQLPQTLSTAPSVAAAPSVVATPATPAVQLPSTAPSSASSLSEPSPAIAPQTIEPLPAATPPSAKQPPAAKPSSPLTQDSNNTVLDAKSTVLNWIQDPAIMLRVGGGFVALALLLVILLCWPKSKQKKASKYTANPIDSRNTPPLYATNTQTQEETADLEPEYDFMGTEAAIPTRLDLARGYIEMGKYLEARAAIKPVLMKGNEAQKQEARYLLEKIELADTHIP